MSKNYLIEYNFSNCVDERLKEMEFGKERPYKVVCENCGCPAVTSTTNNELNENNKS